MERLSGDDNFLPNNTKIVSWKSIKEKIIMKALELTVFRRVFSLDRLQSQLGHFQGPFRIVIVEELSRNRGGPQLNGGLLLLG